VEVWAQLKQFLDRPDAGHAVADHDKFQFLHAISVVTWGSGEVPVDSVPVCGWLCRSCRKLNTVARHAANCGSLSSAIRLRGRASLTSRISPIVAAGPLVIM